MITFENIKIVFGEFTAIPNLTLHIKEGEFFTLLGPSGCGKTTALRALAGLIEPADGSIYIDGKDVTKLPSDKRQLGMVFQNYALFPTMSVRDNIAFGLKVKKVTKDERNERVEAIAKEVELTKKQLDRSVGELSGGQQQRVAIARSLITRPKILLLDEPLSNLDAKLRSQLRVQLKEMQQHFGITSVYVTHDQTEALSMSDNIAVLNHGVIEQVGTPREVYSHSKTDFVCNFIGDANKLNIESVKSQGITTAASSAYARVERIHFCPTSEPTDSAHIYYDGTICGERYEGITTTYYVDIQQPKPIKVVMRDDGSVKIRNGEKVRLKIHKNDLLMYGGE